MTEGRTDRIIVQYEGGPYDGSRRDLTDVTGGNWPSQQPVSPPLPRDTPHELMGSLIWVSGTYYATDEYDGDARIYRWREGEPKN